MKEKFEKENTPKLSNLDVKGREISGLDPKFERFTVLQEGEDYIIREFNKEVVVDSKPQDHFVFINPGYGDQGYLVEAPHWRTITREGVNASIETTVGKDFFYTVNTKGVGYLKPTLKGESNLDQYSDWKRLDEYELEGVYGLGDKEDFFNSDGSVMQKARYFADNGLRTECYWAIAKLKNVIYKSEKKSIQSLQKEGVIPNRTKIKPEIALRLLKTNIRVAELKDSDSSRQEVLMREAFDVFNKETKDKNLDLPELHFDESESWEIFAKEFTKRMAKNLAVLQNLGYIGWHMHSANITLAAEIIDIGPYLPGEDYKKDEEFIKKYSGVWRGSLKDMRDICYDLKFLYQSLEEVGNIEIDTEELQDSLVREYSSSLDEKILEKNKSMEKGELVNAFAKISRAVLVENRRLQPLKSGFDIDDWGVL